MDRLPEFPPFDIDLDKSNTGPRWDRWIGRLENLFVAMEIVDPSEDDRKRALLLHYCGERVYDIYIAEKGTCGNSYSDVKKVLDDYFKPRKNTQMEIYKFRTCRQNFGQSVDEYVTELRTLSKDCEFADNDKEILSQLIQNCRSNQLRRRALREPEKGLEDIIKLGRAMELSDSQAQAMERGEGGASVSVNAVYNNQNRGRGQGRPAFRSRSNFRGRGRGQSQFSRRDATSKKCWNCGGNFPHKFGPCPAKGKVCHGCHKRDHFKKMCPERKGQRPRKVNSVDERVCDESDDSDDSYCYGITYSETVNKKVNSVRGPFTEVKVNNTRITLLADSGSSVNILDETDYRKIGRPKVTKMKRGKLVPYGGQNSLKVLGICQAHVETKDMHDVVKFHVVKGENLGSIMGFNTATKLSVIKVVNKIQTDKSGNVEDEEEFKHLFKGIGKLKNRQIKLHVDKDVQPVAQRPRKTPFHLRDKVKKEIDKLIDQDVIEKVEGEPTQWVSPIVTPPKRNPEEIRLCVDMREANKAIRRERHIMPTMEELIVDLNGAKMFSKLDLRCGYHQLELENNSRYITTFSTHLGIYRYKRLNFGICSASEIFQETIRQVIQNIPGARNISDDILVYGKDQDSHDKALRSVLRRLSDNGLTLNGSKYEFRKDCIFRSYIWRRRNFTGSGKGSRCYA